MPLLDAKNEPKASKMTPKWSQNGSLVGIKKTLRHHLDKKVPTSTKPHYLLCFVKIHHRSKPLNYDAFWFPTPINACRLCPKRTRSVLVFMFRFSCASPICWPLLFSTPARSASRAVGRGGASRRYKGGAALRAALQRGAFGAPLMRGAFGAPLSTLTSESRMQNIELSNRKPESRIWNPEHPDGRI